MGISFSTSWFRLNEYTPEKLIKKLIELEVDVIELQYNIPIDFWKGFWPLLKKEGIRVSSIHNFFPIPEILEKGSGDAFLLTSLDENELKLALKYSSHSIKIASEIEAPIVIFHTGNVPVSDKKKDLFFRFFDEGKKDKAKRLLDDLMEERKRNSKLYFDRLLTALEHLIRVAERESVKIGIENRYFPNEIPLPEELADIFKKFSGAPLRYWHDFGHAHHLEILGLVPHREWLEKFRESLVGLHLHDARERDDHLAPGIGEINFYELLKLLPKNKKIIKVVEVHPKVKEKELSESFKFLKNLL
ncbi:sugar phosphate isomerase/epimerase [Candidatus Aminicenantes bacterium AH-873-B07]|nr:sugar phosphate isomerase/epimerase [Candidatus Aminicenantes bacterium AH-873-B07]